MTMRTSASRPSVVAARRFVAFSLVGALAAASACAGRDDADGFDPTPWATAIDSAGDTTVIRITGAVPESHVRTLATELQVGAEEGSEEETFGQVQTVLGTPEGGLLVHDAQAKAVRIFDAQGDFVRTIGRTGGGPGEYEHLNGIVRLGDGRLVFWDATGGRLNFYSPAGEFSSTVRMPFQGFFSQNILVADRRSRLYALGVLERDPQDFTRNKSGYIRMDSTGRIIDSIPLIEWRPPTGPLTSRSPDGRSMTATSVPFMPGNFTRLRPDGGLVTGPGDPYTIYLIGGDQPRPVRIEREHEPVPVSDTEASERRAAITANMSRLNPSWSWTGPGIPSHKPAYRDLHVGRDGSIWVMLSSAAEPIPAEELPPQREGAPAAPRITTREPSVYDVFSPDGRLRGRVALPPRTRIYSVEGNQAWGVQRDSLDVEYAVRMRIEPAFAVDN